MSNATVIAKPSQTPVSRRILHFLRYALFRLRFLLQGAPGMRERWMEPSVGTWLGVLFCHDSEGRLLGEEHGLAPGQRELPDTTWQVWKQPGSRHGRLFNATAMRSVAGHWSAVLSDLTLLRQAYLRRHGTADSAADLYYLARISTSIPAYLMRRAHGRLRDGEVPARQAALFKVAAGVHAMIDPSLTDRQRPHFYDQPQPAALVSYIEEQNMFVAGSGRVCSGPERMVGLLMSVALGQEAPPEPAPEPPVFEPQLTSVLDYGLACARLELTHALVRAEHQACLAELDAALANAASGGVGADVSDPPSQPPRVGALIFDHIEANDGLRAREFEPPAGPSAELAELDRCLSLDLGVQDEAARRAACRLLILHARADRAFTRLSAEAARALGRDGQPDPPPGVWQRRVLADAPPLREETAALQARLSLRRRDGGLVLDPGRGVEPVPVPTLLGTDLSNSVSRRR